MTRSLRLTLLTAACLTATAGSAAGQASRAALIDEARGTFDQAAVIRILHSAMHPTLGAPDSLWATAGYELALALIDGGQPDRAALWLRAIARHAPRYPIDRNFFTDEVVAAYDQAAQAVSASADEGTVSTAWRWPASLDPSAEGTIEVTTGAAQPNVNVESIGPIQPGGIMSLPPGTYTIAVTADGWEPVRVSREVLPGTAIELDVALIPMLTAAAETEAASNVVRITFQRAGAQICRSGYVATTDGYVLTTLDAVRDASGISVAAFGGRQTFTDVPVVATDAARDLAVLRLPVDSAGAMRVATDVSAEEWVWSVQSTTCADPAADRTRLETWSGSAAARLGVTLPATAAGAPLVNRSGFLVGIVTGPSSALPDALTRDLIERARALIAVQVRPPAASGGGFPWTWVGVGAAVAGAGVALAGGGGGDDGPDDPDGPTTGGIIITFPGN